MNLIIPSQTSREVTWKDLPRVLWDSLCIKLAMRRPFEGRFPYASSIAHCQITDKDPLRFFVTGIEGGMTRNGILLRRTATKLSKYFGARIIMNPVIVSVSGKELPVQEACMSLPKVRKVKRWEIVECEYLTFFGRKRKKFYLARAQVIQHEVDHFDNTTIDDRWRHLKK